MKCKIIACAECDAEFLKEKFDEYTIDRIPCDPDADEGRFIFKITRGGNIVGGCVLSIDQWRMACISCMWVDEQYRGHGLGSAILRKAESVARKRGCYISVLGTFDFQAMPFYAKHGYKLCGSVMDWPRGHESYAMMKRLDRFSVRDALFAIYPGKKFPILPGKDEDADFLNNRLEMHDVSIVPYEHQSFSLGKCILNGEGSIIAGCLAEISGWNSVHIDLIWVDEAYRDRGLGSRLLSEVEHEAKERGGFIAIADAFEWQAGILEKNGYKVKASILDCPKGHSWHCMSKYL